MDLWCQKQPLCQLCPQPMSSQRTMKTFENSLATKSLPDIWLKYCVRIIIRKTFIRFKSVLLNVNFAISVTRLGDLLDFGNFLKPLAAINLPKSPTFLGNFVKVSKSIIFQVKSFLGNFYRHLAIF